MEGRVRASIFEWLERVVEKPEPFSVYTTAELWTDPHTSERMLAYHLDPDVDVSSRRPAFIDESVSWMVDRFGLSSGSRIIDFGCGPGLYTHRFAATGADVTGVDFSPRSIAYARRTAKESGRRLTYHLADYLEYEPAGRFDLVTMIMCDFCAIGPDRRSTMLRTFAGALADDGRLVLDVYGMPAFARVREEVAFEANMLDGFWSPDPYFGFRASFPYEDEHVSLDKFTIVEAGRVREVYNWLQYFTPDRLERELEAAGLEIESILGHVAGAEFDPEATEFAIVAKK